MELLDKIAEELELGEEEEVAKLTQDAIDQDVPVRDILNNGLLKGMDVVGVKFKNHDMFLPEVLLAAKAMHAGMVLLKPLLIEAGVPGRGKVVIGTVEGDLHDIGKNLVGIMLKGAGYEVIDLGYDVAPEKFVEAAKSENSSIIGMSALLTTTMPMMKRVIGILNEQKLQDRIKTVVGGAPVSQAYAEEIGADAYGFDGANAVQRVAELLS
ncbi:MAG: cobalamin-binding protein [bacterium]|nr:cobalamin-binding protein [bacterium]